MIKMPERNAMFVLAGLLAMMPVSGMAQPPTQSTLAAWSSQASMPPSTVIQAGYAPIDQALATLVPAPYHILVDRSVSRHAVLAWRAGNDWMSVLRNALAPMGLRVRADWNTNTIEIYPGASGQFAPSVNVMPATPETVAQEPATASPAQEPAAAAQVANAAPVASATLSPAIHWHRGYGANANGVSSAPSAAPPAWPSVGTGASAKSPPVAPVLSVPSTSSFVFVKGGNNAHAVKVGAAGNHSFRGSSPDATETFGLNKPFDGVFVMPAGEMLSKAMSRYAAKFGWKLKWGIGQDFKITVPFSTPKGNLKHGILYIVRVYQSQGGLLGVQPFFYAPNRVVAMRHSTTPQAKGQE